MDEVSSTRLSEAKQRLLEQWHRGVAGPAVAKIAAIPRRQGDGPRALSFAQQRFWFLHQLEPTSAAYHLSRVVRLRGPLHRAALVRAVSALVHRHEVLRTVFAAGAEGVLAVVRPPDSSRLEIVEMTSHADHDALTPFLEQTVRAPFDLEAGPLFRPRLAALSSDDHVLVLAMHHILADGWSLGLILSELATLYGAFIAGAESPFEAPPIQFADVAAWQRSPQQTACHAEALTYWQRVLDGACHSLELPTDRPRPEVRSPHGGTHVCSLSPELSQRLRRFARSEGTTLYAVTLAAVAAWLHRLSGQDDFLVGTSVANRDRAELEAVVGPLLETQLVRLRPRRDLRDLVRQVQTMLVEGEPHQHLPYQRLIDALAPDREAGRNAIFQVMFTFQNAETAAGSGASSFAGLDAEPLVVDVDAAMFDLQIVAIDSPEGLGLRFGYAAELFDGTTIERWAGHLATLLEAALASPTRPVRELPLLDADERSAMLEMDHRSLRRQGVEPRTIEVEAGLHRLFASTVERQGEKLALVDGERRWTYAELDRDTSRLAHHLRALGAGPETLVGVCLEPSAESVLAILGILKAGAAYLPIDTDYPPHRQAFMLADARAPILVTQASLRDRVTGDVSYTVVLLDPGMTDIPGGPTTAPELDPREDVDCLAYVVYTSGSTGTPKGVMVSHRQVVRLFRASEPLEPFSADEVRALLHSIAFDCSVWEMWGAFLFGGRLVVVDHDTRRAPEALVALLRRERVTYLCQTPSAFAQLLACDGVLSEQGGLPDLRVIKLGGEAAEIADVKRWFDCHGDHRPRVLNFFGPTETTVIVSRRRLVEADAKALLGGPIADMRLRLLDASFEPVPIGVPGELHFSGDGLVRGYLGRPALTAERFVPDPFSSRPGARLYRTGDLGRYHGDDGIEFLGRGDDQVKIRGFRVELGEVKAALLAHPDIVEAAAIVRHDGSGGGSAARLVAYLVPRAGVEAPAVRDLREQLRARLPAYMVPAAFVTLDALPKTAGGKLDRRSLPAPSTDRPDQEAMFVAPRNAQERAIAAIWGEVLDLEVVGIYDNFFDVGGNSMLLVESYGLLRSEICASLQLVDLIRNPTVVSLASYIAGDRERGRHLLATNPTVGSRRSGRERLRQLRGRRGRTGPRTP